MSKWLHYKRAKADPHYIALKNECMNRLTNPPPGQPPAFRFTDVAKATNMSAFADSIRWDYVVRMLEDDEGATLVAVTQLCFKKNKTADEKVQAAWVAGPHGKCVGYANVCPETEDLYLAKLELLEAQKQGFQDRVDKAAVGGAKQQIPTTKIKQVTGKPVPKLIKGGKK